MITIIAGSRIITNYEVVLNAINASQFDISAVVSGRVPGVDLLGERYATELDLPIHYFVPQWDNITTPGADVRVNQYGKKYNALAGFMRNDEMAKFAESLIAVWDGKSKGTQHMIKKMRSLNKPVFIWTIKHE